MKIPDDEKALMQAELRNLLSPAFIEIEQLLESENLMEIRQIAYSIRLDLERIRDYLNSLKKKESA